MVLWTLLLLGVITASLSTQTRKQAYLTRNGEARAEAAAEGGIIRGISALLDPRSESRWAADGSSHSFVLDGIVVDVRIVDEAGKLDLNTGAPETLAALLEVLGAGEVGQSIAQGLSEQRSGARTGRPRPLVDPNSRMLLQSGFARGGAYLPLNNGLRFSANAASPST